MSGIFNLFILCKFWIMYLRPQDTKYEVHKHKQRRNGNRSSRSRCNNIKGFPKVEPTTFPVPQLHCPSPPAPAPVEQKMFRNESNCCQTAQRTKLFSIVRARDTINARRTKDEGRQLDAVGERYLALYASLSKVAPRENPASYCIYSKVRTPAACTNY